jgi:hypothetical protein
MSCRCRIIIIAKICLHKAIFTVHAVVVVLITTVFCFFMAVWANPLFNEMTMMWWRICIWTFPLIRRSSIHHHIKYVRSIETHRHHPSPAPLASNPPDFLILKGSNLAAEKSWHHFLAYASIQRVMSNNHKAILFYYNTIHNIFYFSSLIFTYFSLVSYNNIHTSL